MIGEIILGVALAVLVVHAFIELWEDKYDHEFDLSPFGMPEE